MRGLTPLLLPAISIVFLLQACGGGSSGSSDPGTNTNNQPTELEGTWQKYCSAADPGEPDTHYDIITLTFTGNRFASDIRNYEDATCSVPLSFSPNPTASGTFSLGNTGTIGDGTQATEIDTHITTHNGAPFQIDDYGIYRIEGDILYNDDDSGPNDGSTPALRPNALDYNRPFHRQ